MLIGFASHLILVQGLQLATDFLNDMSIFPNNDSRATCFSISRLQCCEGALAARELVGMGVSQLRNEASSLHCRNIFGPFRCQGPINADIRPKSIIGHAATQG